MTQPGGIDAITETQLTEIEELGEINTAVEVNYRNILEYLEMKEIEALYMKPINFGGVNKSASGNDVMDHVVANSEEIRLTLYPNPTSAEVTIQYNLGNNSETAEILLLDLTGKVILRNAVSQNSGNLVLSLGDLQSGVYIVRLTTSSGENWTEKLVKLQ